MVPEEQMLDKVCEALKEQAGHEHMSIYEFQGEEPRDDVVREFRRQRPIPNEITDLLPRAALKWGCTVSTSGGCCVSGENCSLLLLTAPALTA